MPRRRIATISVPSRPDSRRGRGNAKAAQHRASRGRRGQLETVVERRVRAFELRKAGSSYREIARQLGVDVHTAHADVGAELAAIRETTVAEATALRSLELERLDGMTSGLWRQIQAGSAPAVSAGVRVSERRSRLLGLDAPTTNKTEFSGSLSIEAQTRLAAEREEFRQLELDELEDLARESNRLVADAIARSKARRNSISPPTPSPVRHHVDDEAGIGAPAEQALNAITILAPAK
jgi:hypothetical protein